MIARQDADPSPAAPVQGEEIRDALIAAAEEIKACYQRIDELEAGLRADLCDFRPAIKRIDSNHDGVVDIRIVSRLWALGEIGYTFSRRYWGQGFNIEAGELLACQDGISAG